MTFHTHLPKGPRPPDTWMCIWCGDIVSPEAGENYANAADEMFLATGEWPDDCHSTPRGFKGLPV